MSPEETYRQGLDRERAAAGAEATRSDRLTAARIAAFVGLLACLALADPLEGAGEPAALAAGGALFVAFVLLVRRHRRVRRALRAHEVRARLHEIGLFRLRRDWDALDEVGLPSGPDESPPDDHPYAADLHLFGHASLFRLAGPLTTAPGRATLAAWLAAPGAPSEVARRQGAVRALAGEVELRHRLAELGMEGETEREGHVASLLGWAESPAWLVRERGVRVSAAALPPLTLGLFGAYLAAGIPPLWVLPFVLQIVALRRVHERIAEDVDRAVLGLDAVRRHVGQLRLLAELPGDPLLDEIRERVGGRSGVPAHEALRALRRRLDLGESRRNLVYQALDLVGLVSVWMYRSLERWKDEHGEEVAGWIDALGKAEAISALATLAHDHPGWCFPRVGATASGPVRPVAGAPTTPHPTTPKSRGSGGDPMAEREGARFVARALGHPLLPPGARVANDVEIGPPGSFLLVTGSNMSGKSTLLRAVGANAVLAQAGAPACAGELSMPSLSVWTSMMVGDSLEDGVSRFMAELLRLKSVVDAARASGPEDPTVLYLLDEILQGTNTAERRVAARTALRHLLDAGAVGAVTSHDLTLHRAPDLERRARAFHFRETVERVEGRPRLHFDFELRPGLATTTNALDLLEAVGLGPVEGFEEDDGEAAPEA